MNSYTYTAYGLRFSSSFPLPELMPWPAGDPDLYVTFGEVPETLSAPSANGIAWQSSPGCLLLSVPEVGRYMITENSRITIEPLPGTTQDEVRIFLLGSVLGALLHSRQMLVLHAGAIETPKGAVLFMGRSGGGKSTLTAGFSSRGYALLADDKVGIRINPTDGFAEAMPGFPLIRLSKDSVSALNFPVQGNRFSEGLGKYVIPIENFGAAPVRVRAAYALEVNNKNELYFESLLALDKFDCLNQSTYRRRFIQTDQQHKTHFQILSALSDQVRVTRVVRPANPSRASELIDRIEEDLM